MALAPGTSLGPYDIVSVIGAGGMGEVYRGRDKKLQRDVAIKVLPESVAADSERTGAGFCSSRMSQRQTANGQQRSRSC